MTLSHHLRHFRRFLSRDRRTRVSARHPSPLQVEHLEDRTLLTVSITPAANGLFDLAATGGAGNDNYLVRLNPADAVTPAGVNLEIFEALNNAALPVHPTFSISRLLVNKLTVHGDLGNDLLTVDFSNGTPIPPGVSPTGGLTFDGDAPALGNPGSDRLLLINGFFLSDTHTATGPTSGTITLGGVRTITYNHVEQIDDMVTLALIPVNGPGMVFNATAGADSITVDDGPLVNGVPTTQLRSAGTFTTVNFAHKPRLTLHALGSSDFIDLDNPVPAAGLGGMTIDAGAGFDTVFVQRTSASVPVTILGGTENDFVQLGTGNLDLLRGAVMVDGQDGTDTVFLDDNSVAFSDSYTVTASALTRIIFGGLTYDRVESLRLDAENGNNVITVQGLDVGTTLTVNGGNGIDMLVGPNQPNLWTLTNANALANLNGNVFFVHVEGMTGGTSTDRFLFSTGDSVDDRIVGGGGSDWLDYSALLTGVTVNLATGSASLVAGGLAGRVSGIENVSGGGGNDILIGDAANNILLGRGGNDTLTGGAGRDLLIGGLGADVLSGQDGEDLLIGGWTAHDNNPAALAAIMTEWSRLDLGFAARRDNLQDGTGLNGVFRLDWDDPAVPAPADPATVFDDFAGDILNGGADRDWLFLHSLDQPIGYIFGTDKINEEP